MKVNKRIKNKKIKEKYIHAINHLSKYCELSKEVIIQEHKEDLVLLCNQLFSDEDFSSNYYATLDSFSMGLMMKYESGWFGKQCKDRN